MMKNTLISVLLLLLLVPFAACNHASTDIIAEDDHIEQMEQPKSEDTSNTECVLPLVAVKTLLSRNGFIVYSSDIPSLNCTVLLPESWRGKYELGVFQSAVKVYCAKASENTGTWLGSLCTFSWGTEELSESFELSQPGKILKNEEGFHFFIEYASDVQYSSEDAADYLEMAADLEEIKVFFGD